MSSELELHKLNPEQQIEIKSTVRLLLKQGKTEKQIIKMMHEAYAIESFDNNFPGFPAVKRVKL